MSEKEKPLFLFREFDRALKQCIAFATFAEPGELAFCIGPSGAGKTSLSKMVGVQVYGEPDKWQAHTIPFIRVIADNPDRGFFSPKELTRSMLSELRDPFRTAPSPSDAASLDPTLKARLEGFLRTNRTSEPEMRQVIQNVGSECGLKLIVVDEANVLALTHLNRTPTDYLESLRTLGKLSGVRVMLFGTMDMLELRGFSAQLNRSSTYIHVDRMRCEDEEGDAEFLDMLCEIESWYGLSKRTLTQHASEVLQCTYGIPGEIDSLVRRAKIKASSSGGKIDWKAVQQCRASVEEIERMRLEADVIDAVINNRVLTKSEKVVVEGRKKSRMKPRRRASGRAGA